jgi:hypothetical protein
LYKLTFQHIVKVWIHLEHFFMKSKWIIITSIVLIAISSLFYILIIKKETSTSETTAFTATNHGAITSLQRPAFLFSAYYDALIWQPEQQDTSLTYMSLTNGESYPILPYPDVIPQDWQAAPADDNNYHVVWLEMDGRLRSALIDPQGQTVRGPVELAPQIQSNFIALPYQGKLLVFWLSRSALMLTEIDGSGLPHAEATLISGRFNFLAGGITNDGIIHLAWLTATEANTWAVHYQSTPYPVQEFDPRSLLSFHLEPGDTVARLSMGLDTRYAYLFLSATSATTPQEEHIQVLSFPFDQPITAEIYEVVLSENTPLRWISPSDGQHSLLRTAAAVKTPEGWRPAIVYFQAGTLQDFEIVASQPANAAPPIVGIDSEGQPYLAWSGLDGAIPTLYTAH